MSEYNHVQIKLASGENLTIKNIKGINIIDKLNLEFITYSSLKSLVDSTRLVFPINDIKEIRVERFDPIKTIFTSFWITLGSALLIVILFFPDGFSVGG